MTAVVMLDGAISAYIGLRFLICFENVHCASELWFASFLYYCSQNNQNKTPCQKL